MIDTRLCFVLSSGRSGSKAVASLLNAEPGIEAHHEWCRDAYQCSVAWEWMQPGENWLASASLCNIYRSAAHWSEAKLWVDSSNKLAWCAELLVKEFPQARFVHLVRDGRKVVSSFWHKLPTVYDDRHVNGLCDWLDGVVKVVPPPDEDWWWPVPRALAEREAFRRWDRFKRLCWHWNESNRTIKAAMVKAWQEDRARVFRLEELADGSELDRLLSWFGVECEERHVKMMGRPEHVKVPIDWPLTGEQAATFREMCGETMFMLGYDVHQPAYQVNY